MCYAEAQTLLAASDLSRTQFSHPEMQKYLLRSKVGLKCCNNLITYKRGIL